MAAEQPNNIKNPLCAGLLAHVCANGRIPLFVLGEAWFSPEFLHCIVRSMAVIDTTTVENKIADTLREGMAGHQPED